MEIPALPGVPIIGNLFNMHAEDPIQLMKEQAAKYGDIYTIKLFKQKVIMVGSSAMLNELCDERRFEKCIHNSLREMRNGIHDGLFTAYNDEPNWGIAHRTLVPAFGPLSVASMFDSMKDIATQLLVKWDRHGPSNNIPLTEDFTRLTLDTITLCALNYRLNTFYTEEPHQFVRSFVDFLLYSNLRSWVPSVLRPILFYPKERKLKTDIDFMCKFSQKLVQERIDNPKPDVKDLLNAMLEGKDPKTGMKLSDSSITDNLLTFLIAGHETTSGMLAFTMYYLLKNKEAYQKVQEEVDRVVGTESVQAEHLARLPYINAVLRESSRLTPTAPAIGFTPLKEQELIGGKYIVKKGDTILAMLTNCHKDPRAFGEDAEEFHPERMLDENLDKLPPNSWKTFGNGKRGCIGKTFAWQEMLLVIVMLFQRFDFEFVDPEYKLSIAFTLTIKPKDLSIRAIPRPTARTLATEPLPSHTTKKQPTTSKLTHPREKKEMTILFGSNSGTCEALAHTMATDAQSHGFMVSKIAKLDTATKALPTNEPVVIIAASYEGQPTDDAVEFYQWLDSSMDTVQAQYAIFGCGHADWKQTFHKVPKSMKRLLDQRGAEQICEIGLADASKGSMMSDFQNWEDTVFWPAMMEKYNVDTAELDNDRLAFESNISVEVSSTRGLHLRTDAAEAKVLAIKTLTEDGEPQKKSILLQLPSSMTYRAGDYCAILPFNPMETVHRVMTRFSLPFDAVLSVVSQTGTALPTDRPVSALDLFSAYVELSQPATRRDIAMLINTTEEHDTKAALTQLILEYDIAINDKRSSLLDILELYPSIQIPLSAFIGSLIPMRVRQYSIASSPVANPQHVMLVYDVLDSPSVSGHGRHIGVASNYLSSLRVGDVVNASIKASHQPFHLPEYEEAASMPIVLIAAGAGIAPFRGFIQERAAKIAAGVKLAKAHLFFGCRGPNRDDLFRSELDIWQKLGAVEVHRAYSRSPEHSNGHRHIDETLIAQTKLLITLWEEGAKLYVCGSRAVGESVKQAFLRIASEMARERGEDDAEDCMQRWFEGIRNQRYATDVFT